MAGMHLKLDLDTTVEELERLLDAGQRLAGRAGTDPRRAVEAARRYRRDFIRDYVPESSRLRNADDWAITSVCWYESHYRDAAREHLREALVEVLAEVNLRNGGTRIYRDGRWHNILDLL